MSALSSYLDGKVGFEQWFIKARESHSCLGWLKICHCNRSMKRSTFQSEYTSEIIKEKERILSSEHSLSNLEVICLISQTIILVTLSF